MKNKAVLNNGFEITENIKNRLLANRDHYFNNVGKILVGEV